MTPMTSKTAENQNILLMEIYNIDQCSIYNEQPTEKKNKHGKHDKMKTISLIGDL